MKYSVGFVYCPVLARGLSPLSDAEAGAFLTSKYISSNISQHLLLQKI